MGEANENRNRSKEMLNLSLQLEKYPRDLLQRFMSTSDSQKSQVLTPTSHSEEEAEEIELNLGLSLGGRFGVDKSAKKKLLRSSSIAGSIPIFREIDLAATTTTNATTTQAVSYPTLIRTSSLPAETEEEWRKRKELQTLRRMEAKRRRSEKQRNSGSSTSINPKMDKMDLNLDDEKQILAGNRSVGPSFGMQSWAAAARQALLGGGGKSGCAFFQGLVQPCSQGSVESQGGSSSGMSEFDSKLLQGTSSGGEARSPISTQALGDRSNQEIVGLSGKNINENPCKTSGPEMENPSKKLNSANNKGKEIPTNAYEDMPTGPEMENPSKKLNSANNKGKEIPTNAYEDMPSVFTKGDGPNGRRIEGILYRYGKGEEVRIICVCHGSFLTPAEFVKHAGGGDVDHPLRHIVVNPSSAPLL